MGRQAPAPTDAAAGGAAAQGRYQPRYRQLAQILINAIRSGQYPVGSLLPTELELCGQFGVSRFTMREAIKLLVQSGLVGRQARIGTRVKATESPAAYRQTMRRLSDLDQYSVETHLYILAMRRRRIGEAVAETLRATAGEVWLRAEGVRRIAGEDEPICHTELFIHPAYSGLTGLDTERSRPVYTKIEQQFEVQVAEVQQEIRATALTRRIARLLAAAAGAPALLVSRHYINRRGQVIEVAISTHPADRFSYSQSFTREWPAG